MAWKIEISPAETAGDGCFRIAEQYDGESRFALIIENHRKTEFRADNRVELFRAIVQYGLLTHRLDADLAQAWLDEAADFQPLSLEERKRIEETIRSAESEEDHAKAGRLMSGQERLPDKI